MKEGERKLVVTFLGDAKYGRTVHSLSKLLGGFVCSIVRIFGLPDDCRNKGEFAGTRVKLNYVTPTSELVMPREIVDEIASKFNVEQIESREMTSEILAETDVLYVTRVQKERWVSFAPSLSC